MKLTSKVVPVAGRLGTCTVFAILVFLLAALPGVLPVQAGVDRWTAVGPDGGEVTALLAHPMDSGVVYAGTLGGGVFVSRDRGETWGPAAEGLFATQITDLAMAAVAGAPLFAGTDLGIFRLDPGSSLWQEANGGFGETPAVGRLAVDPAEPDTLYATVTLRRNSGSLAVWRTTDGGTTWANASGGLKVSFPLAVAATSPTTIYATSSRGIYRSNDSGVTWSLSTAGLPTSRQAFEIVADPTVPSTIYASAPSLSGQGLSVFKSVNGGSTWSESSQGLLVTFGAFGRMAADPNTPGTVFVGLSDGVYRSTNSAGSWLPVNSRPANRRICSLAVDAVDGIVYAGVTRFGEGGDLGVLRSRDDGQSWSSHSNGLQGSFVASLSPDPTTPGRILISTDSQRILASDDDGASWGPAAEGIAELQVGPLTRDPRTPGTLYTVAGESRFSLRQVYRSTDSGASWQAVGPFFENGMESVAVDGENPATLYATDFQSVWRSTDGGTHWQDVSGPLCGFGLAIKAHPRIGRRLLAGCVEDSGAPITPPSYNSFLLSSRDGGSTWQRVLDGPSGFFFGTWLFSYDEGDPRKVFAGLGSAIGAAFRSANDGSTWDEIEGLRGQGVQVLLPDPERRGEIFAGTTVNGVLRSRDGGTTWAPFNPGLGNGDVQALAFDSSVPERIWAGTFGGGVHVLDREALGRCVASSTSRCLLNRFRVEVEWERPQVASGSGTPLPLPGGTGSPSETTAAFWFFREGNPELAVKVLDGRGVNGHFWVFYGGLTTVRYTLTVTDFLTGQQRVYENPAGRLASAGDNRAFPVSPASGGASAGLLPDAASELLSTPVGSVADGLSNEVAQSSLVLLDERFRLDVRWHTAPGANGDATSVPLTPESGAFWFFRPENLELFVKILDGRPVNGHYWLFFGSLSNVGFDLTVTDTQTGATRTYTNPIGTFGSRVDVTAF